MENIIEKFKEASRLFKKMELYVNQNNDDIKEIYILSNNQQQGEPGIDTYLDKRADKFILDGIEIIKSNISFIEKVIDIELPLQPDMKLKSRFINLLMDYYESLYFLDEAFFDFHILSNLPYAVTKEGLKNFESIFILAEFVNTSKNIILIGANGSGKSSLARSLKGNEQEVISVIPAQKSLHFSLHDKSILTSSLMELENMMLENNIRKSKEIEEGYYDFQYNQFTRLIVALKNDYFRYLVETEQQNKEFDGNHMFSKLKVIFNSIFSDIELRFDTDEDNFLSCKKNGSIYNINGLSEGEKATLYYTISVLAAKENSFIIVDEPETYLNPSLANTLWDLLINSRSDCQFIFITHSIDFVLSRDDSKLMWLKSFTEDGKLEIEDLEGKSNLPKGLLTEILGSKKSIVFCEGDDKTSLDARLYRSLFGADYTVIPVGGHRNVIDYTKSINSNYWLNIEAYGIIDRDFLSKEKIDKYRGNNIIVMDFNEVEMFLLCDEIVEDYMKKIFYEDSQWKILDFKKEFREVFRENLEKQVLSNLKYKVDSILENEKIQEYKSKDQVIKSLQNIYNVDIDALFDTLSVEYEDVYNNGTYCDLLKYCSLKNQISKELANKHLDQSYITKVLVHIKNTGSLKEKLLNKYFSSMK